MQKYILTINGGSSSIKFALYSFDDDFNLSLSGRIERIGLPGTNLSYVIGDGKEEVVDMPTADFAAAIEILKTFLGEHVDFNNVAVIGHRVVHGMGRGAHAVITSEVIEELRKTSPIDPEHLPFEIALIEMYAEWQPSITQVACFDTVFHHEMPRVAQILPLPRRFDAMGVRRCGFHGLSCEFIMDELRRLDPERANGRVIIAHLGNGASVTAVKNGKSFDTSMGFTPTAGIPMSTRTGDMDPGVLLYIMKSEGHSQESLSQLVNHESGLLGISETSSNMYDLLEAEASDGRAHEAVDLFCYEVKKKIGAYAAALGGVDVVVFTGGMGEKAPRIRKRICDGLGFVGIVLDDVQDQASEAIISQSSAKVCVRVMHTNEEIVIARIAKGLISK